MTYLHWETDRARERSAATMKKHGYARLTKFDEIVNEVVNTTHEFPHKSMHNNTSKGAYGQWSLGRVFLIAAALAEAMGSYTDQKVIEDYLTAEAPLHPHEP
jgi:hypothetical protein